MSQTSTPIHTRERDGRNGQRKGEDKGQVKAHGVVSPAGSGFGQDGLTRGSEVNYSRQSNAF